MRSEAEKKAVRKYKQKLTRLTLDFTPAEKELIDHINSQPKKQTYIKNLIREDMKKEKQI